MESSGVLPNTQVALSARSGSVMRFSACPIHCRVHWRVDRRQGFCRLTSAQPLIGSNIREFVISCALWVLQVLCYLY